MARRASRIAIALGVLIWLVPAIGRAQTPVADWRTEVRSLLTRRAVAVERNDMAAFRSTMQGAPAAFVSARSDWFTRIHALPLGTYGLDLDDASEFDDLATQAERSRDIHIVQVSERIGFRGYDRAPAAEDLFLTVVKKPAGWSVVGDTDRESLELFSMRNLWDFGPVTALQRDGIMVITHPALQSAAPKILTAAAQARGTARARWPFSFTAPLIITVPATVAELARIIQADFDLSTFVAFATASEDRSKGWALTGHRVMLHWQNFSKYDSGFQQIVLSHEFTHIASFDTSSIWVQSYLDEGVAQFYGENAGGSDQPYTSRRIRAGTFDGHLPENWLFTTGPDDDIYLAYEEALSFMTYLGKRFGHDAGARAYRAAGAESDVSAGTWRYHLDHAFRATFHQSLATLERGWADAERKDLG